MQPAHILSTFLAAIQLASHSNYVVSLPEAAVHTLNTFANLVIVKPPFPLGSFDYVLIWHKRSEEDPSHRWFRQMISSPDPLHFDKSHQPS